ncbi:hypothetical protein [Magnetospirillum sulfuroxidans]|uniref:Uncharacterized protein n=1 Tax=Magnetospirillum sulfuroxidans TaxID=611300 RepID=A0ABS5IBH7_9PROT|nr:hypothetical protein [Magnetospirillum sulfuroxidans]MBR9971782.1 hypothetical protein [Magnetospirillum sulfuroxidans]
MIRRLVLCACLAILPISAAGAEQIGCPDLAQAVQVGDCPSEAQLKYSYAGYCSDDARMYDKDNGNTCVTLEDFKKLKNHALWEAGDFQGYLHCGRTPEQTRALKLTEVKVAPAGKLTRVVCTYEDGAQMVLRTRRACTEAEGKITCD